MSMVGEDLRLSCNGTGGGMRGSAKSSWSDSLSSSMTSSSSSSSSSRRPGPSPLSARTKVTLDGSKSSSRPGERELVEDFRGLGPLTLSCSSIPWSLLLLPSSFLPPSKYSSMTTPPIPSPLPATLGCLGLLVAGLESTKLMPPCIPGAGGSPRSILTLGAAESSELALAASSCFPKFLTLFLIHPKPFPSPRSKNLRSSSFSPKASSLLLSPVSYHLASMSAAPHFSLTSEAPQTSTATSQSSFPTPTPGRLRASLMTSSLLFLLSSIESSPLSASLSLRLRDVRA
mmetsp:Transcript_1983/g.4314  ORF Transcript_1983/g.4314 Transcript_1983/m.4314 type:complete len:287 (-) Transcript_1983:322-1182(-)